MIVAGADTAFDGDVVTIFRRIVFPHPVGTQGHLADGRTGVVASVDPARPDVPIVRLPGVDGPVEVAVDTRRELAA